MLESVFMQMSLDVSLPTHFKAKGIQPPNICKRLKANQNSITVSLMWWQHFFIHCTLLWSLTLFNGRGIWVGICITPHFPIFTALSKCLPVCMTVICCWLTVLQLSPTERNAYSLQTWLTVSQCPDLHRLAHCQGGQCSTFLPSPPSSLSYSLDWLNQSVWAWLAGLVSLQVAMAVLGNCGTKHRSTGSGWFWFPC